MISADFRSGFSMALGAFAALTALQLVGSMIDSTPRDNTDPPTGPRSGIAVRIDHLTGCQYLTDQRGGLYPRLGADGRQICGGRP